MERSAHMERHAGPDPRSSASGHGQLRVAVVIPSYRVSRHILAVIRALPPDVDAIYVVDDACPEGSGRLAATSNDPRVHVLFNERNLGVGGAVMRGYRAAIADGNDLIVKVDGDGQMDPAMLPRLLAPLRNGQADYTKGNRFYDLANLRGMPRLRVFGNSVLSFMAKLSTGYWGIFDPANGYTAIHARVAAHLPADKVSQRYFFETDLLFRLNTLRAVVTDIPMRARYGDEASNLREWRVAGEFAAKHAANAGKRIFYNYFLRDMSIASLELVAGSALFGFGLVYGLVRWALALRNGLPTPLGEIMLAVLPLLVGIQLLLAFLGYDIANTPRRPIHGDLPDEVADQMPEEMP
jgi:glycosyltransferase involved in cell wall biosynthesis